MAEGERQLPVTSPADLSTAGHVLLIDQSETLRRILLALWEHRRTQDIEIGVFDFTEEHRLAATSDDLNDDTSCCIEYHVTSVEVAPRALEELQSAFDSRKETPSASGTWVLLVDGLTPENRGIFEAYLKEGKEARMYVIAATQHTIPPGPMRDAFDTIIAAP